MLVAFWVITNAKAIKGNDNYHRIRNHNPFGSTKKNGKQAKETSGEYISKAHQDNPCSLFRVNRDAKLVLRP